MGPFFTPHTLKFLRALKRNNNREWFGRRKADYERHVRAPMLAVIDQLAVDFRRFAPEMIASPKSSLYRVYRDTRFSEDKTPYKVHVAAGFRWRGLEKGEGAGLYVEVHPDWVWMGGGFWAPETRHLVTIREHIAGTWPAIDRVARGSALRRHAGPLHGDQLTRVPRGYAKDHPAAEYLRYRQFMVGREFPATFATSREFYPALLRTYRAAMPLIRFINQALTEKRVEAGGKESRSSESYKLLHERQANRHALS